MQKAYLKVTALEYIDWFPGFIRSELKDRHGKIHEFVEKIPVMCGTDGEYGAESLYPVEITFSCVILNSFNENGNEWFNISTEEPYQIKSEEGKTEFEVNKDQIILG
jgi:hypothetical protein